MSAYKSGIPPKFHYSFDYRLQVWTVDGIVQMCDHPARMREHGPCCNAARLAGRRVSDAPPVRGSALDVGPL